MNAHEEKGLIASVENEEWTSVSDLNSFKKRLMQAAAEQKVLFDSLLKKWGKVSASEAEKILEERESVEPEADLSPELISILKKRIAQRGSNRQ